MKVNFKQEIKTIGGKDVVREGTNEKLTLADVAINALLSLEDKTSGEEKFKRYALSKKIHENTNSVDLKVEEITLIKEMIGKIYAPLIVGQTWDMLENDTGSDA
jgi:hypothetical protein